MIHRKSLLIAAGLTGFILVILGAVTVHLTPVSPAAGASSPSAASAAPPLAALDPNIQQQIAQREATYQQQISEANRRLQLANDQLKQAYGKGQVLADQQAQAQQVPINQQSGTVLYAAAAANRPGTPNNSAPPPATDNHGGDDSHAADDHSRGGD